jgi:serine/threonine protein kinase
MRQVCSDRWFDETPQVMMSSASDSDRPGAGPTDSATIETVSPFDGTDVARQTQLSDPPTAVVRRHASRMSGDDCIELPPGSIVGEMYEIDAVLGAGAMGEVYAARHLKLGKRVAIKVMNPQLSEDAAAIERFAHEARTLAKIQHPAIVAVEHVGELPDNRAYFVMEFLKGESLFERLQRGRIPLPEALRILDQMARGLEAAHGHGVIHRDLKPENTFLVHLPGEPSIVKLVDFGLAKIRDHQRADRTQSGVAIGTPMYMSPEQARGPDVDPRTDIYALGCVAYELVLGVPPFPHAKTTPELYAAHLHEAPALPRSIWPEIPTQLDLCLFAMLAKDPAHRPTLAQIRSVLEGARSGDPQRAPTEFVVDPRTAKTSRKRLRVVGLTLVALIGTLIAGITIGARARHADHNGSDAGVVPIPSVPVVVSPALPPVLPVKAQPPPLPPQQAVKVNGSGSGSDQPIVRATKPPKIAPKRSPISQPPVLGTGSSGSAAVEVPDKKPVDRNQTINPFAKKRPQVTP